MFRDNRIQKQRMWSVAAAADVANPTAAGRMSSVTMYADSSSTTAAHAAHAASRGTDTDTSILFSIIGSSSRDAGYRTVPVCSDPAGLNPKRTHRQVG